MCCFPVSKSSISISVCHRLSRLIVISLRQLCTRAGSYVSHAVTSTMFRHEDHLSAKEFTGTLLFSIRASVKPDFVNRVTALCLPNLRCIAKFKLESNPGDQVRLDNRLGMTSAPLCAGVRSTSTSLELEELSLSESGFTFTLAALLAA